MNLQGVPIYVDGYAECGKPAECSICRAIIAVQHNIVAQTPGPRLHKDDLPLIDGPYAGRVIRFRDARQGYSLHFPRISGEDAIYAVAHNGTEGPALFYVHTQPAPVRTEREQRIDAMWSDELVAAVDGKPYMPKFAVAIRNDYVNILGLTRREYVVLRMAVLWSRSSDSESLALWQKLTINEVEL